MDIRQIASTTSTLLDSMQHSARAIAVESSQESEEPADRYSMVDAWPGAKFLRVTGPFKTAGDLEPNVSNTKRQPRSNSDFYEYRETPWQSASTSKDGAPELSASVDEISRAIYLNALILRSNQSLHAMFDDYHDFRHPLSFVNPELAKKYFGFTLGPDLNIKVTDPDGVLTPAELSYLDEKLNERKNLKSTLHQHARTVMELVDHLTEKFADRYVIELQDYHKVIDYGQIFTRNSIGNFMDTWAYQIERYARKRDDSEEHQAGRVNIKA